MVTPLKNAHLSTLHPSFAPLVPAVNAAFKKIWTYDTMSEFRGNWGSTRASYAACVPVDGFEIAHRNIPVRDGVEVELRIWRPEGSEIRGEGGLPCLFVCHGGGE
jgi:acetyl esterase/lipase